MIWALPMHQASFFTTLSFIPLFFHLTKEFWHCCVCWTDKDKQDRQNWFPWFLFLSTPTQAAPPQKSEHPRAQISVLFRLYLQHLSQCLVHNRVSKNSCRINEWINEWMNEWMGYNLILPLIHLMFLNFQVLIFITNYITGFLWDQINILRAFSWI